MHTASKLAVESCQLGGMCDTECGIVYGFRKITTGYSTKKNALQSIDQDGSRIPPVLLLKELYVDAQMYLYRKLLGRDIE